MAAAAGGLRSRLLRASLPYIPQHGFRLAAVRAALAAPPAPSSIGESPCTSTAGAAALPELTPTEAEQLRSSDAALGDALVPGGAVDALSEASPKVTQVLLSAWDAETDEEAARAVLTAADSGRSKYGQAVAVLEERLHRAGSVREHLVDALAAECSQPLPTAAQLLVPGGLAWSALVRQPLPTPVPLAARAWRTVAAGLRGVGWKDESYYTDWYALRMRLAAAYGLAELHLASPVEPGAVGSVSSFFAADTAETGSAPAAASRAQRVELATELLRGVAWARETSLAADAKRATETVQAVAGWGGRGWLGILRAHSL